jgi:prepilin-type N-terminal cleavage/methylation domain-containing protein
MTERGFSLVELIVAILILTVGILGLAATAGQVERMVGWGGRIGGSAMAASSELELLRGTPCSALGSSGTVTQGIYSLSWTVSASGQLRTFTVTVTYPNGTGTRSDVFQTERSCV